MSHLEYPVVLRNQLGHGVKLHHERKVWRTAIKLAKPVYELTRELLSVYRCVLGERAGHPR